MLLVSWSRPCVLVVFSNRIFVKSEDWGFFSSKLFKVRAWHEASLPVPFCCPPAILVFCNDDHGVSFTDVQFIHVLKGDRERNVACWEHRRAQEVSGGAFLNPALYQHCQCPSGSEIPDNEGLSILAISLRCSLRFPQPLWCLLLHNLMVLSLGMCRKG